MHPFRFQWVHCPPQRCWRGPFGCATLSYLARRGYQRAAFTQVHFGCEVALMKRLVHSMCSNRSALHLAALTGQEEALSLLIAANASLDIIDKE